YMYALAAASDRVQLEVYAHTYEQRPLLLLIISSVDNLSRIEEIRQQHVQLSSPTESGNLDIKSMPVVTWLGYSVHGNEASGSNSSLLVAYHLAAAQGSAIDQLLDETIVLIDPSINPDGLNRFASWVNSHKSQSPDTDPNNLEHNEAWPRGRTNHYWFDLNRDWLPVQHPESQGRLKKFHHWKPNILTDHHEMGTNRTFFFQPGIPSRNHPLTPAQTFELTAEIGKYHAEALDKIGSLYYSKEGYDDYYYGKGSTYPDVNGSIGILFEQASSRGHAQKSDNGTLTFPFAIRNHFTTSLSSLQAGLELRTRLLEHQRTFYQTALRDARADQVKGYVFGSSSDPARTASFLKVLQRHQIKVHTLSRDLTNGGQSFSPQNSFVVSLEQPQYRLIQAIFEKRTSFQDSLFYDVSAWTLPLAFNLDYSPLDQRQLQRGLIGAEVTEVMPLAGKVTGGESKYAYLFRWDGYYAPRALQRILKKGLRAMVSNKAFTAATGQQFDRGTIVIPVVGQKLDAFGITSLMQEIANNDGIEVFAMPSGQSQRGVDLGSPSLDVLKQPKIMLLAEGDINSYEVGEVWHLMDQRYKMNISLISQNKFNQMNLDKYNTLIMVNGQYKGITAKAQQKLKAWVEKGNTVIATKGGAKWLSDKKISKTKFLKEEKDTLSHLSYGDMDQWSGAQVIGGAIFKTKLDLSHPLGYGFPNTELPVFRNSRLFMERSKNPFTNPLMYDSQPLLSGYISAKKEARLKNSAAIDINHIGKGLIISMTDNPNFRAFWYGTNKLLANGIFFGPVIESGEIK
ncbi:MAG: M14 family metallopeptidase, partial [Cyclobacteriaceae bacterium]